VIENYLGFESNAIEIFLRFERDRDTSVGFEIKRQKSDLELESCPYQRHKAEAETEHLFDGLPGPNRIILFGGNVPTSTVRKMLQTWVDSYSNCTEIFYERMIRVISWTIMGASGSRIWIMSPRKKTTVRSKYSWNPRLAGKAKRVVV